MKKLRIFQKVRIGDVIIIAVALAIAACGLFVRENAAVAQIYVDGALYETVSLNENEELTVNNVKIIIGNGEAYFEESDCPDKLCVKSGKLSKKGQTAACVPNRVVMVLGEADVDGVTG